MEEDLKMKEIDDIKNDSEANLKGISEKTHHPDDEEDTHTEEEDEIDDLLDQVPPDFNLAEMHRDANRVKDIREDKEDKQIYENEEDFCPCCQMPTSKVAPLFNLCTDVFNLEDLG